MNRFDEYTHSDTRYWKNKIYPRVNGVIATVRAISLYLDNRYDGAPDAVNIMTHDEIREMLDEVFAVVVW